MNEGLLPVVRSAASATLSQPSHSENCSAGVCECERVHARVCVFKRETVREIPPPQKKKEHDHFTHSQNKITTINSRQAKEWVSVLVWQAPG